MYTMRYKKPNQIQIHMKWFPLFKNIEKKKQQIRKKRKKLNCIQLNCIISWLKRRECV